MGVCTTCNIEAPKEVEEQKDACPNCQNTPNETSKQNPDQQTSVESVKEQEERKNN